MIPWLRSRFSVYVFEASLVATLLALLVSIVTNTTMLFKVCLVIPGCYQREIMFLPRTELFTKLAMRIF